MKTLASSTASESDTSEGAFCPVYHRAVELIGRRWTGAILRALLSGVTHFSELTAVIPELSDRMLSVRLHELEAEGLVARTVIPATPVRVEYRLTEKGRALSTVMDAIGQWAHDWLTPAAEPSTPECAPSQEPVAPARATE